MASSIEISSASDVCPAVNYYYYGPQVYIFYIDIHNTNIYIIYILYIIYIYIYHIYKGLYRGFIGTCRPFTKIITGQMGVMEKNLQSAM